MINYYIIETINKNENHIDNATDDIVEIKDFSNDKMLPLNIKSIYYNKIRKINSHTAPLFISYVTNNNISTSSLS